MKFIEVRFPVAFFWGDVCATNETIEKLNFFIVTYLSFVDDAEDSPLEFFGEFPAIKTQNMKINLMPRHESKRMYASHH